MAAVGRPSNESKSDKLYLKEQCQLIEKYLNDLETICTKPNIEQKEDFVGTVGLLVGKIGVRFLNIESKLDLFDEEDNG